MAALSSRRVIDTPLGSIIADEEGGVVRALGVPYAEAPCGVGRFRPAHRRAAFTAPFPATRHGATPQQGQPFGESTIPEPSIPGSDILHLSVTAPADAPHDASLPVVFWIHGGGFAAGSPASPWYDGAAFAREAAIVVRPSYRLGVEGFGAVDGDVNRGLLDLLLALEWVQECIGAFGGDPERITLAGQSAGASAVLWLLSSPATRGQIAGAVALSPAELAMTADQLTQLTEAVAVRLGVPASAEGFATVQPLALESAYFAQLAESPLQLLGPAIPSALLPHPLPVALAECNPHVPLLIGSTADEFDEDDPGDAEGDRLTDRLFRRVIPMVAAARPPGSTWSYSFDWPSAPTGRAGHCSDLPFFFDDLAGEGVQRVLGADPPQQLADAAHAVMRDVVFGRPLDWPAARGGLGDASLIFGADGNARVSYGRYDVVTPAATR